jgi:hypothetical protein
VKVPAKRVTARVKKKPKAKAKHKFVVSAKARHLATVHAAATRARHKAMKRRGLSPGGDVCVIDAVTACLGWEPPGLFTAAGGLENGGVMIPAVLEALAERGLIAGFAAVDLDSPGLPAGFELRVVRTRPDLAPGRMQPPGEPVVAASGTSGPGLPSLLLGVDLPGPHAVVAVPGGWLSWGQVWPVAEFPDAVVEEAWEVTWAP